MIFSGANTDEIFGVHRSELRPLEASDRSTGLQAGLAAIYCGAHSLLRLGLAGGHSLRGREASPWLTGHQVIV